MTTMQRATFDDLMATPEDDHLYELVRGESCACRRHKGRTGASKCARPT